MRRDSHTPALLRAVVAGMLLFAGSTGLLAMADEALDVTAIAGGIGLVMSGALLGLTMLVARWRLMSPAYVATQMPADDAVAAAFDDPAVDQTPLDDAAAG